MINVQVLEVATGEGDVSNNLDLAVTDGVDNNVLAKVADTALDLDAVVEELLEGRDIEDLVASGLRSVDDELRSNMLVPGALKDLIDWTRFFVDCINIPSGWSSGPCDHGPIYRKRTELAYCSNMSSSPVAVAAEHVHAISGQPNRYFNIRPPSYWVVHGLPRTWPVGRNSKAFTGCLSTYSSNGSHCE